MLRTTLIFIKASALNNDITFVFSGHGRPVLVFPWVVMQELDYLKTGKTTSASLVSQENVCMIDALS